MTPRAQRMQGMACLILLRQSRRGLDKLVNMISLDKGKGLRARPGGTSRPTEAGSRGLTREVSQAARVAPSALRHSVLENIGRARHGQLAAVVSLILDHVAAPLFHAVALHEHPTVLRNAIEPAEGCTK